MQPTATKDSESKDGFESFKSEVVRFKQSGRALPDPMPAGNPAPGPKEHNCPKAASKELMPMPDAHRIFYIPEVIRIGEALLGQAVTEDDLADIIILPRMRDHEPQRLVRSASYPFYYLVKKDSGCVCKGWFFSAKRGEAHCSHHDRAFPETAQENKLRYAEIYAALKDPSKTLPPVKAGISSAGFKPVADEVEIGQVIEGHPTNATGLPEVVEKALAEAGVPFTSVELRKGKGLVIRVPKGTPFEAVSEVLRKVAPGRAASVVGAAA